MVSNGPLTPSNVQTFHEEVLILYFTFISFLVSVYLYYYLCYQKYLRYERLHINIQNRTEPSIQRYSKLIVYHLQSTIRIVTVFNYIYSYCFKILKELHPIPKIMMIFKGEFEQLRFSELMLARAGMKCILKPTESY